MKNIDFTEAINYPIEQYVIQTMSSDVNVQKETSKIEKNLAFDDPQKYGDLVSYKSKLLQISELGKGRTFGDTNIQHDWVKEK